ncbi:hypothetical protein HMPREF1544_03421, partial [Mucor circinelloides 1006PhL]
AVDLIELGSVEPIILSSEGNFFCTCHITQIILQQEPDLDDASFNNIQLTDDEHIKRSIVPTEINTNHKSAWYKLKI